MKTIVIDARESGTSTGRYIDKLIEYLYKLRPPYEFIILTKQHRMDFFAQLTPKFKVVLSPYVYFTFGEQIGFKKQLDQLNADLVHYSMVQQPVLYRGKTVTTMHDLTRIRFNNPAKNLIVFTIKQQIYKWLNKLAAHKTTAIIAPSNFVKNDVANYTHVNPTKITVTYEAADLITEPAKPIIKLADGKPFIMYVGTPHIHKNLERLIEAFIKLQVSRPDLKLALVGKKNLIYERIEQSVNDRGIKNVIFTDFVSEGNLRWLYEHCAAYIFPSLSEGFGLPGLEAMVHGAPVVSSNATCLPEIYGEAAHYFNPLDVDDMVKAINDVLTDEKLRQDLIAAGQVQAKKYSWQRMAEQTLAVYKKSLS